MMHVVTFYRFCSIRGVEAIVENIRVLAANIDCVGSVLIAEEGINATIANSERSHLETLVASVEELLGGISLHAKYSIADEDNRVFYRLKVKHRREIINFGHPLKDQEEVGKHVDAEDWNRLLDDPNTFVLDVRNEYETEVGVFENAQLMDIKHFRDFPDQVAACIPEDKQTPIAMYCTGGIRCEKASNWLIELGYENVNQLNGGILSYLESTSTDQSKWRGECFVFDQRVTVNADLEQGDHKQCFACRRALSQKDIASEHYVEGVSCPSCYNLTSTQRKEQFAERMKQDLLAKKRGLTHIGATQQR